MLNNSKSAHKTGLFSISQGRNLFAVGAILFAAGFAASLYSVSSSQDPQLPSFPILELGSPIIPVTIAISSVMLSMGGLSWHHSTNLLLAIALGLFVAGVIVGALGLLYPIRITANGVTVSVYPYSPHASELILEGLLLAVLTLAFRRLKPRSQNP